MIPNIKLDYSRSIIYVSLIIALCNFLYSLSPSNSFVHADYFRYILEESIKNGLTIKWGDIIDSMQLRSPGEFRSRFLAYGIQALDQKIRLYLYDIFFIHSTLAPIAWFFQLFVGPTLLFLLLKNITKSVLASLVGLAIYISSIGFLSGFTMGLLQGKALSSVAFLAALYFCQKINKSLSKREYLLFESKGLDKVWVLLVLFIGLFLDELPFYIFPLLVLVFPNLFFDFKKIDLINLWRMSKNLLYFCIPLICFFLLMGLLVPVLTRKYLGFEFDYFGNLFVIGEHKRGASSILSGPYASFNFTFVLTNFTNLFGLSLSPYQISPLVKSNHGDYFGGQVNNLFQLSAILVYFSVLIYLIRKKITSYTQNLQGFLIATVLFMFFITILQIRHIPIVTGYYYGCAFSVLFSILTAIGYSLLLQARPTIGLIASIFIMWIVIAQIDNFRAINLGWIKTHNEDMTRSSFDKKLSLSPPSQLNSKESKNIWLAWKQGNLEEFLSRNSIQPSSVYLVYELRAINRLRSN